MTDALEELGLLEDEEIELDRAALVLSALDHLGGDLGPSHAILAEIDERLADVGGQAESVEQQAEALRRVFAQDMGFVGDVEGYGAPVNADLVRVLERRQGLPVSLSILYVSAARRMGWSAWALNTPGHVLVRLGAERFMLIDPFNAGMPVSGEQFRQLVRQYTGRDGDMSGDQVAPIPNRAVLVRLLVNQASRAEQSGDLDRALTLYGRMTRFAPGFPEVWWELARLQRQTNDGDGARASLNAMLEVTRDPKHREVAISMLEELGTRN